MATLTESKSFMGYLQGCIALVLTIVFFSGAAKLGPAWMHAFDYNTLLGKFGTIGNSGDIFLGKADPSVRQGFLLALSYIPGIMLALGAMSVAVYFGALDIARICLGYVLSPLTGLPGGSALALISSLQSSDSGAALSRELYDKGLLSGRQRDIFAAFQFSSGASIGVYLTAIPVISNYITVELMTPLAVIILFKLFGTNIMRWYVHLFPNVDESSGSYHPEKKLSGDHPPANPGQAFVKGAQRGWSIAILHMLPNVLMAYIIIALLSKSGAMDLIGDLASPVMGLFDLNGKTVTVLIASWMSGLGGVAVASTMFCSGDISATELTILCPAIFLMGAQIQYTGRILAVMGIPYKRYKMLFTISIINAALSMLFMKFLLS
ncbi:MAG: nucleoside recognition domain-containing protein [Succinivibrionaceae bacterium]